MLEALEGLRGLDGLDVLALIAVVVAVAAGFQLAARSSGASPEQDERND